MYLDGLVEDVCPGLSASRERWASMARPFLWAALAHASAPCSAPLDRTMRELTPPFGGLEPNGPTRRRLIAWRTCNTSGQSKTGQVSHLPAFTSNWQILRETGFRAGNMVHARSKVMTSSKTSRRRFWEFRCESTGAYKDFLARNSSSARTAVNRTLVG